jgi:hypothetical protein
MELIRTTRKEKLPRGFSYPIGAEILSAALYGVPQYGEISLTFMWKDTFWASKYQAKLKKSGSINLLEFYYQHAIGALLAARWNIWLHAVPSEHAHDARQGLSAQALPALKAALDAMPHDNFRWSASWDLASRAIQINA